MHQRGCRGVVSDASVDDGAIEFCRQMSTDRYVEEGLSEGKDPIRASE